MIFEILSPGRLCSWRPFLFRS